MTSHVPAECLIDHLLSNEYVYGDFISKKDVERATKIQPLTDEIKTRLTAAEITKFHDEYKMELMKAVSIAKDYFLHEKKMYLATKWGQGYQFIHPREQLDYCLADGMKYFKKGFSRQAKGIENINNEMLDSTEVARNKDALAQVNYLRRLMNRENGKLLSRAKRLTSKG